VIRQPEAPHGQNTPQFIGKGSCALYSVEKPLLQKTAAVLIVLAMGGPSAGILQCELACATESAVTLLPHCHGAGAAGTQVQSRGRPCDHDAGTLAATSPDPLQKSVVPMAAVITATAGVFSSLTVHVASAGLSPPGSLSAAPPSLSLPLRI